MKKDSQTIKNKIIKELEKKDFPDLKFLFSTESLGIAIDVLHELLEERKERFHTLIQKPLKEIEFDDFIDFSKLSYFFQLINHIDNTDKSEISEKIIEEFMPTLTEFGNEMQFSFAYYERICYVLKNQKLDIEQKRILELAKEDFELDGINLPEKDQKKIKKINIKLSKLQNDFSNNIVKSKKEFSYNIIDLKVIEDLPKNTLENAKQKAKKEKKQGYLFTADPTSIGDIMDYCSSRKIRKDFGLQINSFATKKPFDNRPIVLKILKLQQKKAHIMGYKNFAGVSLSKKMAKKPETVFKFVEGIQKKAFKKASIEIEELKNYFNLNSLESFDIAYYSRKFKEEKYLLDEKELKNYFEYNQVVSYLFDFVRKFYGLDMRKTNTKTYNEDVVLYEVYKNNKLLAYYLLDPFYRETKRPGAWADTIRPKYKDKIPCIVNVCNFQKGIKNTLLTKRDVETIFHEFGHALHEMLSESKYSELSGFNVEWDFVELPSQLHENWVTQRESLQKLGLHFETKKPIPKKILDTLDNLKTYMSGMWILRQNEFTLLDMNLYSNTAPATVKELDAICLEIAGKNSLLKRGKEYKMYASFGHIFGGGYAAGYYSYMRAEILESDVFEKIYENGMFTRAIGEKFIHTILGQGTRKPAEELFFDFMGRKFSNKAFMKKKGLI